MTTDLKPCPICKGECEALNLPWGSSHTGVVWCSISSMCRYKIHAKKLTGAIRLHNSIPRGEKCRWRKEFPDEQCYWWWIADEESGPMVVNFFWSGTTNSYFATQGQLGWKECREQEWFEKHYPTSRWMKVEEPARPDFGQDVEEVKG